MVQPIALVYSREDNARSTTLGWWGDMNLISHIFDIVATVKSGKVKADLMLIKRVLKTAKTIWDYRLPSNPLDNFLMPDFNSL